jgi:Tol biopolymer transport system component
MDDLTPFEQQLSVGFRRLMGPVRPVDDRAILAATIGSRSRRSWSRSPLGGARFALASILVALFGGVMLIAQPSDRQGADMPGAAGDEVTVAGEGLGDIAFVKADYEPIADATAITPSSRIIGAPRIIAVPSEGGTPTTLSGVPGEHWTLTRGSFPFDLRNDSLVGPAIRWSPDGSRIAFRTFNDAPGIYLMDRDGSDLRRLVDLPRDQDSGNADSAALDWSPDGTRIVYPYPYGGIDSPLYVVDIDDGQVTNLTGDDQERWVTRTVAWSPDGSMIAFARTHRGGLPNASRLFVMNADGTSERELITGPEPHPQVYGLAWSPDGSSIAFIQYVGDASDPAPVRGFLRVVDADGSGLRTLAGPWPSGGCCIWISIDEPLAWSPDGTSIAMTRWVGEDPDFHPAIVLVNADGSGEHVLTEGSWFDWSPDGSRLVVADVGSFGPMPSESYAIHLIDADGTDKEWLADGEYPAWSPAGG